MEGDSTPVAHDFRPTLVSAKCYPQCRRSCSVRVSMVCAMSLKIFRSIPWNDVYNDVRSFPLANAPETYVMTIMVDCTAL